MWGSSTHRQEPGLIRGAYVIIAAHSLEPSRRSFLYPQLKQRAILSTAAFSILAREGKEVFHRLGWFQNPWIRWRKKGMMDDPENGTGARVQFGSALDTHLASFLAQRGTEPWKIEDMPVLDVVVIPLNRASRPTRQTLGAWRYPNVFQTQASVIPESVAKVEDECENGYSEHPTWFSHAYFLFDFPRVDTTVQFDPASLLALEYVVIISPCIESIGLSKALAHTFNEWSIRCVEIPGTLTGDATKDRQEVLLSPMLNEIGFSRARIWIHMRTTEETMEPLKSIKRSTPLHNGRRIAGPYSFAVSDPGP
ncbi:hypothetical protein ARMSODRAFT_975833 [Armillaria solidipes]|uniref:Uncharacterized protein n=1 Tax=Armillaria solidipes TaxID=1076256 RepID=A0A2H3BZF8_9AGAR|nr:hypothetical protein ARMSODRAFT_975833 [Armillaria solidipes]